MKHPKYPSYDEDEIKHMADWLKSRWLSRSDSINQATFAKDVLGVSQSAFAQMLNGFRPIPETQVHTICTKLDIEPEEFYYVLADCREYETRFVNYLENSLNSLSWLGVSIDSTDSWANGIRARHRLFNDGHQGQKQLGNDAQVKDT